MKDDSSAYLTIRLDHELRQWLQKEANRLTSSMSAIVRQAVLEMKGKIEKSNGGAVL